MDEIQRRKILRNVTPEMQYAFLLQMAQTDLMVFGRHVQSNIITRTRFHDAYYKLLNAFAHGEIRKLIIQAPPQHGKLLNINELVPTPNGWKRHGDLKVGDYVFGRDGRHVKVRWVSELMECEYRVYFNDGTHLDCHGNHEWVVFDRMRKGKERIIETKEMASSCLWIGKRGERGSRIRYSVDAPVCVEYPTHDVPLDPYTFGAWLSDGKSSSPIIHIGKNDLEIIERIPYPTNENKGTTTRPFHIGGIATALKPFLNNKHIPECYRINSVQVRKEIIAGLIDTDGYVYPANGRVTISNTNKAIIDGAAEILRSLGENVATGEFEPTLSSSGVQGIKKVYQLCFNPSTDYPTVVPRKKINRIISASRRKIIDIEYIGEKGGVGNCIEVEGGIYLAGKTFIPTHNSQGSSRLLPAFMLGLNPDLAITIGSYSATLANDFNRDIQRIIDSEPYQEVFPCTRLLGMQGCPTHGWLRNSDVFEIVEHRGVLRVVGRGGSLTGKTTDVSILDDVYKDYAEAASPLVRDSAWKWYTSVVRTRLHNDSQELIVFTRWHSDDIIGRIVESGEVVHDIKSMDEIKGIPHNHWIRYNFEAIKVTEPNEIDGRSLGEPLWPERHSLKQLEAERALDPVNFQCLHQGDPSSADAHLYHPFKTYINKADYGTFVRSGCYIDVADEGDDNLAAITYDVYMSKEKIFNEKRRRWEPILYALVTDLVYSNKNTDYTLVVVPNMINSQRSERCFVESNAGGAQYEKSLRFKVRCQTIPFYQTANKEGRIVGSAAMVNNSIVFPFGWEERYPEAYKHLTEFLSNFGANAHDDLEDALTGVYEKEISGNDVKRYKKQKGVRRRN